jgi:uncharacterized protein YeaO (DUF488 family)
MSERPDNNWPAIEKAYQEDLEEEQPKDVADMNEDELRARIEELECELSCAKAGMKYYREEAIEKGQHAIVAFKAATEYKAQLEKSDHLRELVEALQRQVADLQSSLDSTSAHADVMAKTAKTWMDAYDALARKCGARGTAAEQKPDDTGKPALLQIQLSDGRRVTCRRADIETLVRECKFARSAGVSRHGADYCRVERRAPQSDPASTWWTAWLDGVDIAWAPSLDGLQAKLEEMLR